MSAANTHTTNNDLLVARKCVLLNSRQSKRPCRRDSWVSATAGAVERLVDQEYTFVTSLGLNTWELALHLVNVAGGKQIVILPDVSSQRTQESIDEVIAAFQLEPSRCAFLKLSTANCKGARDDAFPQQRDQLAIQTADVLFPISLRKGGSLERLVAEAQVSGKHVVRDFSADYSPADDKVRYQFEGARMNPIFSQTDWNHLVHWTRSCHGPFPGESLFRYYGDILSSASYPRSAFSALVNIATSRVILSSQRFIRGGLRVVSLSELNPVEAVKLMRWRKRYVYYSFEPYGIAFDKEYAQSLGIRPAIYGDAALFERLSEAEKPYYQNIGSADADWTPEAEWRRVGNLSLSEFPVDKVRLITHTAREAEILRGLVDYEVIPLILS